MTDRERWFAAVGSAETDQLLFWPKLDMAYTYRHGSSYGLKQTVDFHEYCGSNVLHTVPSCLRQRNSKCTVNTMRHGADRKTVIETPVGTIQHVYRFDNGSQAWHPVEFAIKTAQDVEAMTCYLGDISLEVDYESVSAGLEMKRRWKDSFFSWETVGESPLMNYVEHLAGVETAHYLLVDDTKVVEEFFETFHALLKVRTRMTSEHSIADMLAYIENTSTTLISPAQYRKYCARHISEYAQICQRHGRIMTLHMCGHLRDILPDLAQVGAHVFEAFTSPPVGNTPLSLGRSLCPEVCLIGGTNAALWTRPATEIIAQIEHDLSELPHHRGLVLSSAGVMPPMCEPETVKSVCEWIHAYRVAN